MIRSLTTKCESRRPGGGPTLKVVRGGSANHRQNSTFVTVRQGESSSTTQLLSLFCLANRITSENSALISVSHSQLLRSRELSFYQCFSRAGGTTHKNAAFLCVSPVVPSFRKTQLLSLFCTATRGLPKNSAFITVLRNHPRPPRKLSFYHCFAPKHPAFPKTHLLPMFWLPATASRTSSVFINVLFQSVRGLLEESALLLFPGTVNLKVSAFINVLLLLLTSTMSARRQFSGGLRDAEGWVALVLTAALLGLTTGWVGSQWTARKLARLIVVVGAGIAGLMPVYCVSH